MPRLGPWNCAPRSSVQTSKAKLEVTAMATGKRELIGQMQRRRPLMFSSRNDGQRFMSIDE
jgi:hypothetical protein